MENLLLRCYTVLIAFAVLFMVGCIGHESQEQVTATVEQLTVK